MTDLTSLWVFSQKYKHAVLLAIAGVALFGAGWQTGRVMSPYYTAHPIMFVEADTQSGDATALQVLEQQGVEMRKSAQKPSPTIAGVTSHQTPSEEGLFVASINSTLYHHKSCSSASRIKPENQVWFASVEEAQLAGYSPSKCTTDLGY